jgi:hypothetical protein
MSLRTRWVLIIAGSLVGLAACKPVVPTVEPARLDDWSRYFAKAVVVAGPTVVDCTLSRGTKTQCVSITVKPEPKTYKPGPWCPRSVSDGPQVSGIWLNGGKVHNADGAFLAGMATFYNDKNWQMVDPATGKIKVTETLEQCQGAARPDVGPEYKNFCVECRPEFFPNGSQVTYVIPLQPQALGDGAPTNFAGAGVAFNGVRLDGPAPVQAILGAYTIAPFDDCGGHINPHVGYHYHAVTDCLMKEAAATPHGAEIGIAMDGYKILANQGADGAKPSDLDRCNGHSVAGLGYHHHAGAPGSNAILGCLRAEHGCALEGGQAVCDASRQRPPPPPPPPR